VLEQRCGRPLVKVIELEDSGHAPLDDRIDLAALIRASPIYKPPPKRADYVGGYTPPTLSELEDGSQNIEPISQLVSPVFCSRDPTDGSRRFGLDGVPDPAVAGRPVLIVGNHQLLALDLGPLVREFLIEKGFAPRGLAHPVNFRDAWSEPPVVMPPPEEAGLMDFLALPFELRSAARASSEGVRMLFGPQESTRVRRRGPPMSSPGERRGEGGVGENFGLGGGFAKWGAVPVTPRNFFSLLKRGEAVLLFPGGAREACHKSNDKYRLLWPEKTDFVRLAAKFDALVVPFGGIGAADNVSYVPETWGPLEPLRKALSGRRERGEGAGTSRWEAAKGGGLMPVSEALAEPPQFPFVLPRLPTAGPTAPGFGDRFYFSFGAPVDLAGVDPKDRAACDAAYAEVRSSVEEEIEWLLRARTRDPYREFLPRQVYERIANLDATPRHVKAGPLKGGVLRSVGRRAPSFQL